MGILDQVWSARIAWWVLALGMATVAWQAGPLAWRVWKGPEMPVVFAVKEPRETGAVQANYPLWSLFGRPPEASLATPQTAVEAPQTRLQLDLLGVFVGPDPAASGAIVAERGKEANYFRVDAILPGNARLAAVYPDKILLERAGAMESLGFDEKPGEGAGISPVTRPVVNSAEEFMALARQRLQGDAAAALGSVGLEPATAGGTAAGYVFNGNNPMLSSLNLQKGDVIRSVNGHVLGDIEQDRAMLQQFYDSGMLEVEVERDGAVFSISYPLR